MADHRRVLGTNQIPAAVRERLEKDKAEGGTPGFLSFADWIGAADFKRKDWITVAQHERTNNEGFRDHPYTFSFLVKANRADVILVEPWHGFSSEVAKCNLLADFAGEARNDFEMQDELTPFVIWRLFPETVAPNTFELIQAFSLHFNAYADAKGDLQFVNDAGEFQTLTRFTRRSNDYGRLDVNAHHLRRFLAQYKFALMRFHAHDRLIADVDNKISESEENIANSERRYQVRRTTQNFPKETCCLALLTGKDIVRPYDDPDEPNEVDETFLIGLEANGAEIIETCNPDVLSDYFTDRGKPHFLTDVFFQKQVLKKYYDEPSRFSVDSGQIRCLDKWLLRFDRTDEGTIHVWLGDLHDLPVSEQKHWRLHNVRPAGKITTSRFQRDFEAKFVDPENDPVYYFKAAYERTNETALTKLGAQLFLPLDARDNYVLNTLHVPVTNEWSESDAQIAALAKICPDSINLRLVKDKLPDDVLEKVRAAGGASIRHLEAALSVLGIPEEAARAIIRPLDAVQNLRSSGAAHRKSDRFNKTVEKYGIANLTNSEGVAKLVQELTESLNNISRFLSIQPSAASPGNEFSA